MSHSRYCLDCIATVPVTIEHRDDMEHECCKTCGRVLASKPLSVKNASHKAVASWADQLRASLAR